MKCECCGEEISTSDKFCKFCGEENEIHNFLYEEQVEDEDIDKATNDTDDEIEYDDNDVEYDDSDTEYVEINGEKTKVVYVRKEGTGLSTCAVVFSALGFGVLGVILSIVGLCTCNEDYNVRKCKIGLWLNVVWFMLLVIISFVTSCSSN